MSSRLLLLVSLCLFAGELCAQTTYYLQRESHFQQLPSPPQSVVFLGNSISDGAEWRELFPTVAALNRGISGDIAQGVLDRLPTVLAGKPAKIFLLIGVNDLARGSRAEDVAAVYRRILETIRDRSPETQVFVQSVLPVNASFGKFSTHVDKGPAILALNRELQSLAASLEYAYLDLHTAFTNAEGRLDARYTNDGLHLTGNGYLHWKSLIFHHVHGFSSAKPALLPLPREISWKETSFSLLPRISILVDTPLLMEEAMQVTEWWPSEISVRLKTPESQEAVQTPFVQLRIDPARSGHPNPEAYTLEVDSNAIFLWANTAHGIFNGLQTLRQLTRDGVTIPACLIRDWPAFSWRGFMQDVGRNFQDMDALIEQVDQLSRYKINVFHLHLTEDIAWRIASLKYPQLTRPEYMQRNPGEYYTYPELNRLLAFCRSRHVLLIPEIDMPGHSAAFSRAMGFDMQSPEGKKVVAELLHELCDKLDVPIVHIGSDEVAIKDTAFIPAMSRLLRDRGKQVMGWKPGGNLSPDVIRQLWIGKEQPDKKARYVDSRHLYLNHLDPLESVATIYHRRIGGQAEGDAHVLGAIACVWPDRRVARQSDILQMNAFYPALLALAERSWQGGGLQGFRSDIGMPNTPEWRDFKSFEARLIEHKTLYFKEKSFPYLPQADLHWQLFGPFDNQGNLTRAFWPEMTPARLDTARAFMEANGATLTLRHFWAPLIQGLLPDPKPNSTVYALTRIYSRTQRTANLWAGFNNPSRSTAADSPPVGSWDQSGSAIWLNGKPIPPPAWARAGQKGHLEIPLRDESYAYRAPIPVTLSPGVNYLLVKVPVGALTSSNSQNPVKWMFTALVF